MSANHTPTPWMRGDPEGNDALATIRTADGENVIAEVYFVEGHGTREEAEGDLAHMLVATELADALQQSTDLITSFASGAPVNRATIQRVQDAARAPLRKAGRIQ